MRLISLSGVILALSLSSLCAADGISGSVFCGYGPNPNPSTPGNSASCSNGSPDSPYLYSAASYSGSVTSSIATLSGSVIDDGDNTVTPSVAALLLATITTVGPAGPGVLTVTFTASGPQPPPFDDNPAMWSWNGNASVIEVDAPYHTYGFICPNILQGNTCTYTWTSPITIGDSFQIEELVDAEATGASWFNGSADPQFSMTYSVVDANGNPVELVLAPEPTTLSLLSLAGVALLGIRRSRR